MAIIKEDGRWKTVLTEGEQLQNLFSTFKALSRDEKKLLRQILKEAGRREVKAYNVLTSLEYAERPCPPEKFLIDPNYMGEVGKGTYEWIKRELPNVFNNGYDQIVCTGAQRTGKDWFSHCLTTYLIHLLLCLKDPAQSYGLAKGSNLYIVAMSATQDLARDAIFQGIVEKIKQSPWFNAIKGMKILSDEIRFPKGIILKGAESGDMGVIGLNTCAVIIDEANISRKVKAIHEKNQLVDRTEAIYQAVRRRIRMTFGRQGGPPTLLITLGSRRYPSDFVERRIRELQNEKKALVMDMALWDAKGRENFSDKFFRVLVGNEQTPSRILADGEVAPKDMQVVEVPEDFRNDFEGDCEGSLRDIAGIAVRTISPFFANQDLIFAAVDDSRTHPCKTVEWKVDKPLQIEWDRLVTMRDGKSVPIIYPDRARCVAIDLGRVKNPTGFSIGFVKGYKIVDRKGQDGRIYQENLPYIVTEFVIRITPVQGQEVKFWQVRELLFSFIQHGIPIKYAVLDHWQSDDFCQLLKDQGLDTTQMKTDIKAYDVFKAAIYEQRFKVYNYKPLFDEITLLEHDPKRRKVDIISEDMGNTHHDVADSVCLLVNRLSQDFNARDYAPVAPEMNIPKRRGPDLDYKPLAPGDTPFMYTEEEKKLLGMTATFPENERPPDAAHGFIFDTKEVGWGEEIRNQNTNEPDYVVSGSKPIVRVEVLANEFCRRATIDKVEFVTFDQIKAFLFEKGLTDLRYVTAIKTHVERVYEKKVK